MVVPDILLDLSRVLTLMLTRMPVVLTPQMASSAGVRVTSEMPSCTRRDEASDALLDRGGMRLQMPSWRRLFCS